jgi:hypothetical protein
VTLEPSHMSRNGICVYSLKFPSGPDYTLHAHRELLVPSHAHPCSL